MVRVKPHEAGSVGTSLLVEIFAVQRGLRVGAWNSQMMFTSFYLNDVTHRSMDLLPFGLWWLFYRLCNCRHVAVGSKLITALTYI